MGSMHARLETTGRLAGVLLSAPMKALLHAFQVLDGAAAAGGVETGELTLGVNEQPLFPDLELKPFGHAVPYRIEPRDGGSDLLVDLSSVTPVSKVLGLADAAVGGRCAARASGAMPRAASGSIRSPGPSRWPA